MWDNKNLQEDIEWGNVKLPGLSDEELFGKSWNHVRDIQSLMKTEKWKTNYSKGIKNRDSTNIGKNNYLRYEDSEYLKEHRKRMKKRTEDPDWIKTVNENNAKKRKPLIDPNNKIFDSKRDAVIYYAPIWNRTISSANSKLSALLKKPDSGFRFL